jgi:thiol:disulfide interchange protein DsbD
MGLCACSSALPASAKVDAPLAPAEPQRSAWPEPPKPESVVQAELQTSASGLRQNGKFLLAVRFDILPEYRISWTNPGDVGERTQVTFEVPEGFSVGPVQFPAPTRFELPGGLVNYGYAEKTAVFAEVTAPAQLSQNQAYRFDVHAHWLACKDDCATEELNAWFELVATRAAPEPSLPDDLAVYYSAIPTAFSDLPESKQEWKGSPERPALNLTAQDIKWLDFFPSDAEHPKLLQMKPAGDVLSLKFDGSQASKPLRGLAVGELNGKTSFFDVNLPWPSE